MDLEKSLAERLHGIDPRSGTGALASPIPPPAEERQDGYGRKSKKKVPFYHTRKTWKDIERPEDQFRLPLFELLWGGCFDSSTAGASEKKYAFLG